MPLIRHDSNPRSRRWRISSMINSRTTLLLAVLALLPLLLVACGKGKGGG